MSLVKNKERFRFKNVSAGAVFVIWNLSVWLHSYSLVPEASCRSYFKQLADADFSVFSSTLGFIATTLFNNARSCLVSPPTSTTAEQLVNHILQCFCFFSIQQSHELN